MGGAETAVWMRGSVWTRSAIEARISDLEDRFDEQSEQSLLSIPGRRAARSGAHAHA
jgi:hypothetical protein